MCVCVFACAETQSSFQALAVDEESVEDTGDVKIDDVSWVVSLPGCCSGEINGPKVPKAHLLDAFVSATGYFGNESSNGHVYAQCAVLVRIPGGGSDKHSAATSAAFGFAYDHNFPTDALTQTRAGLSLQAEQREAEARYAEYTRRNKSAGLKKPKQPKRARGGWGYGSDDDDEEGGPGQMPCRPF